MCSYTQAQDKECGRTDADGNVTTSYEVGSVCECHTEIVQRYVFRSMDLILDQVVNVLSRS